MRLAALHRVPEPTAYPPPIFPTPLRVRRSMPVRPTALAAQPGPKARSQDYPFTGSQRRVMIFVTGAGRVVHDSDIDNRIWQHPGAPKSFP